MGKPTFTKATTFMRDNVHGELVVSGNVTKSGGATYKTNSGFIYRLSKSEVETLHRYGFQPRYVKTAEQAQGQGGL